MISNNLQRSTRIKAALKAAKQRGVILGRHGKKVLSKTNKAAANAFAKKMIPVIKELQAEGYTNVRSVTAELNRRGISTFRRQNNKWHIRTVNLLLKRIGNNTLKNKPHPVKWVGGKRNIIKELKQYMPKAFENYYEPFFGGGALFFEIQRSLKKAYLSDVNSDLMTMYKVIQKEPDRLIKLLKVHAAAHSEDYYYKVRATHDLTNPVEIAARMLYLNKTCYNGLWRVNKKGGFNASPGKYENPVICHAANLKACHKLLKGAKLKQMNYLKIKPKRDDFVYFDPPYHQANLTSFTAYTESPFTEKDHIRLARFCKRLHERGVKVMLSNSKTEFIQKLYSLPIFKMHVIKAARMINCDTSARQKIEELLITNY